MTNPNSEELSQLSMLELFRVEMENQTTLLSNALLELEVNPAAPDSLEELMRATHSLKGAARIVSVDVAVTIAHAMEDCFVAVQQAQMQLRQPVIDLLFRGIDLLLHISRNAEGDLSRWEWEHAAQINEFLRNLRVLVQEGGEPPSPGEPDPTIPASTPPAVPAEGQPGGAIASAPRHDVSEPVLRLTAESLNRLLGLAGESLVESRWVQPFGASLLRLRRMQADQARALESLRDSLGDREVSEGAEARFTELFRGVSECQQMLADRVAELDTYERRSASLSHRLYEEVLQSRMRPFADGVRRFPRMVRDLSHRLGKKVRLEISGERTQVDRDILERMETPLAHLLRNAIDHGCETAEERERAGKPAQAVIRLEARHSAGALQIVVADDGRGVDPSRMREVIVARKLAPTDVAEALNESELSEFLFLPGFTLKETVTELSGRGVGLDAVRNTVKTLRGTIRAGTTPGQGMKFQLQLPLTLSVMRTLLFEVAGEPYALPLTQIARTMKLPRHELDSLGGRPYFQLGNRQVGLLSAQQLLECSGYAPSSEELSVVVLGGHSSLYGLVVDRFLGERELVVQPLDPRLGKIKDISAAALLEDGLPVLIIDVEDVLRSAEKHLSAGRRTALPLQTPASPARRRKRILAVDDSLTARELERKLLDRRGYLTDVAVDGVDGWNAVRTGEYDLVITDVDMPRLDGIELAALIKQHPELKSIPVLIISYKDREEDRMRGLEAGVDYYLTKGSFHDETLVQAVIDLIGEPDE